ncbi:unnamed protein product [Peronospora destructor]|nr:unnamed protein product [Peronospora destructor]
MPPAPTSTESIPVEGSSPATSIPGANPYASTYANKPRPSSTGGYAGYASPNVGSATRGPPQFKIFNPKLADTASHATAPVPAKQSSAFGSAAALGTHPYPPVHVAHYDEQPAQDEAVDLSANASVLQ